MTIATRRLILRPFQSSDVDDVYTYAFHPEWGRYLQSYPEPYTRDDAEQFVSHAILQDRAQYPILAIVMHGQVIGNISLRLDPSHRVAELAYALGRNYWRQGFATEAVTAVIASGFHTLGLRKIFSTADARNTGVIRLMGNMGMTKEGLLRSHRFSKGEYVDEVVYGILQSEWEFSAASRL